MPNSPERLEYFAGLLRDPATRVRHCRLHANLNEGDEAIAGCECQQCEAARLEREIATWFAKCRQQEMERQ